MYPPEPGATMRLAEWFFSEADDADMWTAWWVGSGYNYGYGPGAHWMIFTETEYGELPEYRRLPLNWHVICMGQPDET